MSNRRPPSPLRNGFTADDDSEDGSENEEDWENPQHSPSPSIQKFASNFAQRVNTLVGSVGSSTRSAHALPTDAELEAEAERERERSRREAEMILRREAEERRHMEEKLMTMMAETSGTVTPPRRPPESSASPSPSQKEGWFAAVKSKLTPTKEKELLTPAQQIVQETKAKEKEKKKDKGKERESSLNGKNQAFPGLTTSGIVTPQRVPSTMTLDSPSPAPAPFGRSPQSQAMSPMLDSPARDGPPIYAQFNPQGTLDVPTTLLTIARRFEKLERWTVSHVRALEDRMSDVERWLVEKEKDKDKDGKADADQDSVDEGDMRQSELSDIRDELMELQGRVGELGREMARIKTSSVSSGQNRAPPAQSSAPPMVPPAPPAPPPPPMQHMSRAPSTPTASRTLPTVPTAVPRTPAAHMVALPITPIPNRPTTPSHSSSRPRETSPPPASNSSIISNGTGRTRLPYPTGDYTSPPGYIPTKQDILSPTNSPPSSLTESSRRRHMSISGLPSPSLTHSVSLSELQSRRQPESPPSRVRGEMREMESPTPRLPVPIAPLRTSKVNTSPTPRKRYTVALGGPLVPPPDDDDNEPPRLQSRKFGASYSASPIGGDDSDRSDPDESFEADRERKPRGGSRSRTREDTIGKSSPAQYSSAALAAAAASVVASASLGTDDSPQKTKVIPRSSGTPRVRAQSTYGPLTSNDLAAVLSSSTPSPIAPSKPKLRSRSTDRIGLGITIPNGNGTKFIDPLVIRKQVKESAVPPKTPTYVPGKGKVPINELVAFFDGERR